ncbi:uncharacterized protein LOC115475486 isoform X2 [Microcaecilia unicolor]|uniref:Uncharacterized protein LOC115475486 isoform X2 n=1 Tax=Microcaecilia unicolor TaxID=1415580 RepID=A0A6P7YI33_9AMPH|nr:uncharacterized protein LOC115475486 isoform X2 [Microcaecilia unicolor]
MKSDFGCCSVQKLKPKMLKMWSLAIFLGLFALSAPVNGECDAQKVEDFFMNNLDILNLELEKIKIGPLRLPGILLLETSVQDFRFNTLSVKVLKNGSLSVFCKGNMKISYKLIGFDDNILRGSYWIHLNAIVGVQKNPDGTTKLVPLNFSKAVFTDYLTATIFLNGSINAQEILQTILNLVSRAFRNILTMMNAESGVNNLGC